MIKILNQCFADIIPKFTHEIPIQKKLKNLGYHLLLDIQINYFISLINISSKWG